PGGARGGAGRTAGAGPGAGPGGRAAGARQSAAGGALVGPAVGTAGRRSACGLPGGGAAESLWRGGPRAGADRPVDAAVAGAVRGAQPPGAERLGAARLLRGGA